MQKLEFIIRQGAAIAAREGDTLAPTAWTLLDHLCDEWAYPRHAELGRYQLRFGSSGGGEFSYSLRDKESEIVVRGSGRNEEASRRNCLYLIRQASAEGQRDLCWPRGGSLHSSLCTCAAAGKRDSNLALWRWSEEDDFEQVLGYDLAAIEAELLAVPPLGPASRPSSLAG